MLAESDFRLEWMAGGQADVGASRRWLEALAGRHGVDLVHVNGYAQACLDGPRPRIVVAHSDVLSWWMAVRREPAPPEWRDYRRQVVRGLRAAARVVAPTRAVQHDLQRQYGLRCAMRASSRTASMSAPSRRAETAVIMASGRIWDAAKNLRLLDDIAPEFAMADRDRWRHRPIRGMASPGCGLRGRSASLIRPKCAITSPIGNLRRAGSSTSRSASAILEAAAAGCALVLGDIPSLRENWDGAAIFLPPDDRSQWRSALARLIGDQEERERLAAAARARAERFTLARTAGRYRALYRALTAVCRRAPGGVMAKIVLFCHSLRSDWNHGNAHFLRGIMQRIAAARVRGARHSNPKTAGALAISPLISGGTALEAWRASYPDLPVDGL